MITEELLLKKGYKYFPKGDYEGHDIYQKRFRDNKGTKYFIDFDKCLCIEGFEVSFYNLQEDKYALRLLVYAIQDNITIEEIEELIERTWINLGSVYYEECE